MLIIKKLNRNNKEFQKLFSVLLDQAFMSVTTLLTTVVLARTYSKVDYANLVLLFSLTLFILGFQNAIISKPYAINFNDFEEAGKRNYFNFSLSLKFYFTVVLVLIFPLLYYIFFDAWNSKQITIFMIYIIANTSYFFIRETLLSERKVKQNLYYGVVCSGAILALLIFIFFLEKISIHLYLGIVSSIYLIITIIYLAIYLSKNSFRLENYKYLIGLNWKIGKWMLGSNILFFLSSSIYPWLLLYLSNKEDIAVYGVLISVSSVVNPLLLALSSYILPLFVKNNAELKNVNLMVRKWSLLFKMLSLFLLLIGCFFGQLIINILFGKEYFGLGILVVYPFVIQSINIFFQPYKIALNAIKRTDVNFWILIPRSIIAIIFGYFLTRNFGLVGVFYTMIIEILIYQLIYYFVYRKIMSAIKLNSE